MKRASTLFVAAVAATLSAAAVAQSVSQRPDPLDARAGTSPLRFETGLDLAIHAADADPAARWREHNERVRAIGGHAGYLRNGKPAAAESKTGQADKAGAR